MSKKILLMLGAAVLSVSASAATFKQGEAFAYTIDPSFSFELAGDTEGYAQYPADALAGQANLEYGFGMASAWFLNKTFATPAEADEYFPVVTDPWNEDHFALRMQTDFWAGFGNFNFALPEVTGGPCRVRVIYRVDETTPNPAYTAGSHKLFRVKIMHNGDQEDCTELTEDNVEFWDNPGWRVADFVFDLDSDIYYLSILFDGGGLSCQKVPFYVEEVSVVPMSLLPDYTAPAGDMGITVTKTFPDLVEIAGGGTPVAGGFKQGEAFAYDIDPSFTFELAGDTEGYGQYPADALAGQASLEYGFGMASAWFLNKTFATAAEADEYFPVVADPWNADGYAIRMQTDFWAGFGNFNFALPQMDTPSRVRVIYRVDETTPNPAYTAGSHKLFRVKIMHNGDQEDCTELTADNVEFWDNPGWRVADFITELDADIYYLSILFDGGGLSCQKVPFYVEEVSVVPLSLLPDYTAPADDMSLTVVKEMPELVKIDRTNDALESVADAKANVFGAKGAVLVNGFEGNVEVYNLMGMLVAKANVKGNATIAAPAGLVVVKAGNTVAKVVVR